MMLRGLAFILATGVFWAGLAAIVASASRKKLDIGVIQPLSALMALAASAFFIWRQESVDWSNAFGLCLQIACLVAAGVANYAMLLCVHRAMRRGNNGVVWAFTQSSMTMPFAMGIVLFGEAASPARVTGLALILFALGLFSIAKATAQEGSWKAWLLPTLIAFVLSGLAQSFASLPSYLRLEGMTALKRMALTQAGITLAALVDFSWRCKIPAFNKRIVTHSAAFGLCNLLALVFFYNGLNDLAAAKCASIGYPAAQGLSIALFFVGNALVGKDKASKSAWLAFFVLLIGITLAAAKL